MVVVVVVVVVVAVVMVVVVVVIEGDYLMLGCDPALAVGLLIGELCGGLGCDVHCHN